MMHKRFPLLFALLFSLAACLPLHQTPTIPTTAVSPVSLSLQSLRNGSYQILLPDNSIYTIPLSDGVYPSGEGSSQHNVVSARIGDQIAFGDLNGDRAEDAVLTLTLDLGSTGMFTALIPVLNQNGSARQPSPAPLENLLILRTLTIENGEVLLSTMTHGINDPDCCPSQAVTRTYRLLADELWLTHLTSRVSANANERVITIETPADNAQVVCPVTVTGNVSIAPFENTLVYKILTADGEVIEQGPLMVDAPGLGAPGVFTLTFDVCAGGYRGPIRVELWDFNAADGSPFAMDAVYLILP